MGISDTGAPLSNGIRDFSGAISLLLGSLRAFRVRTNRAYREIVTLLNSLRVRVNSWWSFNKQIRSSHIILDSLAWPASQSCHLSWTLRLKAIRNDSWPSLATKRDLIALCEKGRVKLVPVSIREQLIPPTTTSSCLSFHTWVILFINMLRCLSIQFAVSHREVFFIDLHKLDVSFNLDWRRLLHIDYWLLQVLESLWVLLFVIDQVWSRALVLVICRCSCIGLCIVHQLVGLSRTCHVQRVKCCHSWCV